MAEELTYKRLRDLAREEKSQPMLVKLDTEFYSSVAKFLEANFSKVEESPSALQLREFENATATIREIALLRQQKILFRALRNPSSSPTEGELAREEYQTFDRFCAIIGEERGRLDALLARFEHRGLRRQERSAGAGSAPAEGAKVKKVRFLKEVQAYIGANHETFGPFKPGEEGKLPSEEADLLLKQRMAEIVE